MSTTEHTIGIDIGTSTIKVIVADNSQHECPKILHNFEVPTKGFINGYINDVEHVASSLQKAIKKAESVLHRKIRRAQFSIGGIGLSSQYVKTSIEIEKKHAEITERNVTELVQKSEDLFMQKYPNKKILHMIPIKYRVNHRDVLGTPVGMYGNHLEAKIIFITILEHHYDAYLSVIQKNNIDIQDDLVAGPLADAAASLSYKQKMQGSLLLNVGAETTSLATFENGNITSLEVFPIGSTDITNDLALGLQTSLETADNIKTLKNKEFPKRKVDEIISARIADILELAEGHLIKIKKNRMLPAGIMFTGSGARIENITAHAKAVLKLPADTLSLSKQSKKTKRNTHVGSQYSTAYGLCYPTQGYQTTKQKFNLKNIKQTLRYWFDQINP